MQEQSVELVETEATSRGIDRLAEIEGREIMYHRRCARPDNGAAQVGPRPCN
jgi:hypothetical protein